MHFQVSNAVILTSRFAVQCHLFQAELIYLLKLILILLRKNSWLNVLRHLAHYLGVMAQSLYKLDKAQNLLCF